MIDSNAYATKEWYKSEVSRPTHTVQSLLYDLSALQTAKLAAEQSNHVTFLDVHMIEMDVEQSARKARERIIEHAPPALSVPFEWQS